MARLAAAVAMLGVVLLPNDAKPAGASHRFGLDPAVPDSKDHHFCFNSSVPAGAERDRIRSSMNYLASASNMTVHESGSCGSLTDVVWVYNAIPPGYAGYVDCASWAAWGVCEQFWVRVDNVLHFNAAFSCGGGSFYNNNMIATTRHELGHTAGLSHFGATADGCGNPSPGGNDVMTSDWIRNGLPNALTYMSYSGHHSDQIDCTCQYP